MMAKFEDHITQADNNLMFLNFVNEANDFFDWKVTVCFYSAIHLVNAHIATQDLHYQTHEAVKQALNPYNTANPLKFDDDTYSAFTSLRNLSRRSRYLINETPEKTDNGRSYLTYEKHYAKAVRHLDKIISSMKMKYGEKINLTKISIKNCHIKEKELQNFI